MQLTNTKEPFGIRIVANFNEVMKILSENVNSSKRPMFLDFLFDFVKCFKDSLNESYLVVLMKSLVDKILADLDGPKKTLDMRSTKKKVDVK
jgi:hypothetical protein